MTAFGKRPTIVAQDRQSDDAEHPSLYRNDKKGKYLQNLAHPPGLTRAGVEEISCNPTFQLLTLR